MSDPSALDYINGELDKLETLRDHALVEANTSIKDASNHLILVATVIITFTSPIFSNTEMLELVRQHQAWYWSGLAFVCLSLTFGIWQSNWTHRFFGGWGESYQKMIQEVNSEARKDPSKVDLLQIRHRVVGSRATHTPDIPFYLQAGSLAIGVVLILRLFSLLL